MHNLTHLHTSKGLRFKGVNLISKSENMLKYVKIVKFYRIGLKPQDYESFVDSTSKTRFP